MGRIENGMNKRINRPGVEGRRPQLELVQKLELVRTGKLETATVNLGDPRMGVHGNAALDIIVLSTDDNTAAASEEPFRRLWEERKAA